MNHHNLHSASIWNLVFTKFRPDQTVKAHCTETCMLCTEKNTDEWVQHSTIYSMQWHRPTQYQHNILENSSQPPSPVSFAHVCRQTASRHSKQHYFHNFFFYLMSWYAHQSSTVECLRFYLPPQPHFRSSQQSHIQMSLQQCVFTQTKCFSV